jgi:uncharacterized protein with FMN-binding domain
MASNRLSRSVVAVAASAITAVYAAGYVHTQAADASLAVPASATMASAPAVGQPAAVTTTNPLPTANARQVGSTGASGQPNASSSASQSGPTLRDGTYTGVGTSRRGGSQVALTVQGGRIANVNITGASTEYPTRDIASLPGQVVSRQSAQVDVVGGATYSSMAFRGAVQQALQRAQA